MKISTGIVLGAALLSFGTPALAAAPRTRAPRKTEAARPAPARPPSAPVQAPQQKAEPTVPGPGLPLTWPPRPLLDPMDDPLPAACPVPLERGYCPVG